MLRQALYLSRIVFLISLLFIVFVSFFVPNLVAAQGPAYVPFTKLPFVTITASGSVNLGIYLNALFRIGLGVAITLAVVLFTIQSVRYMGSEAWGDKEAAIGWLKDILLGVFLALASWLILRTINPSLLEFEFLKTLEQAQKGTAKLNITGQELDDPDVPPGAKEWPDDSQERQQLEDEGGVDKIRINKHNCTYVGETECTSVYRLPKIGWLRGLENACDVTGTGCLMITGGTEEWLHTTHGPGKSVVDFAPSPQLNRYITGDPSKPPTQSHGFCITKSFKKGAFNFLWEPGCIAGSSGDHWHVTY